MASKKVSELTTTTSLDNNDVFVVNHLGSTNKVTYSTLLSGISSTVSQNLTGNFIKAPATATAQQVLTYNGSTSTWVANDVPKELPQTGTNGQVLTYNGTTWVAAAAPTGGVTLPTGTNGQVLTYNGTTWIASDAPKELPQTANAQQILTYNGSTSTWVASAAPAGVTIDSTSITNGLTNYTLKLADANKVLLCNNTNPLTAAIPVNTFNVGTEIILIQRGGVVTLSAGAGVTVESNGNKLKTNGTSAGVCLINTQANVWFLGGNTAT